MKKILFSLLIAFTIGAVAQENNTWRIGAQWGMQGNHAQYTGGMEDANARFQQKPFGAGSFQIIGRYDINKHWMVMSGLGFNAFGFEFALAENYSFLRKGPRSSAIKSDFVAFEIPIMGFYKFKPNCRDVKWLIGAGFANNLVGTQTINRAYTNGTESTPATRYLNSSATSVDGSHIMVRFAVGREKTFKRGGILNVTMVFNAGLSGTVAKATVNYTVDGQDYTHEFSNNGNYAGLKVAYFFRPIKTKASKKASAPKATRITSGTN
jgi:hypothetical protein